ncbi:hypothetical protein [Streptomyces alboflavus]|uniref:hypothetical protein n=1 Tax=Streptomyces alboflavus TaxID=67267 RepID=UPI0036B12021
MRDHTNQRRPLPDAQEPPRTAADEVLHEVEDAETRVTRRDRERDQDSEAGDALTPNEEAQEEAHRSHP